MTAARPSRSPVNGRIGRWRGPDFELSCSPSLGDLLPGFQWHRHLPDMTTAVTGQFPHPRLASLHNSRRLTIFDDLAGSGEQRRRPGQASWGSHFPENRGGRKSKVHSRSRKCSGPVMRHKADVIRSIPPGIGGAADVQITCCRGVLLSICDALTAGLAVCSVTIFLEPYLN
jgi:hypothetical protein